MNGEKDPDFLDQYKDLERRVRTLEQTPRIPQVSGGTLGPQSATNFTSYQSTYNSYVTPTGGLAVDAVISPKGSALVFATCQFFAYLLGGAGLNFISGHVSVKQTGANSFTPNIATPSDGGLWRYQRDNTTPDEQFTGPITYVRSLSGLAPGLTTFTWVEGFLSDEPVAVAFASGAQMSARQLLVLPF